MKTFLAILAVLLSLNYLDEQFPPVQGHAQASPPKPTLVSKEVGTVIDKGIEAPGGQRGLTVKIDKRLVFVPYEIGSAIDKNPNTPHLVVISIFSDGSRAYCPMYDKFSSC